MKIRNDFPIRKMFINLVSIDLQLMLLIGYVELFFKKLTVYWLCDLEKLTWIFRAKMVIKHVSEERNNNFVFCRDPASISGHHFESQLPCFKSKFLLRDSKWWLKYMATCHLSGRPWCSSRFLVSACPSDGFSGHFSSESPDGRYFCMSVLLCLPSKFLWILYDTF